MNLFDFIPFIAALALAPLLPGVANQVKAFFAGRRGPGLFRLYADIAKLLRKSSPRSATSTWLFDIAPAASLAATLAAAFAFPWPGGGFLSPNAGAALFFYLLGTGRFLTVLGALDTGSAFEGMGASREVQFSALAEPVVFITAGFLALLAGGSALPAMLGGYSPLEWSHHAVPILLTAAGFFTILLSETCRVPFDDPETHLELTMIHEAMILDNSGPDLAFIHYGAALKFELLAAFLASILLPAIPGGPAARAAAVFALVLATAALTGAVESSIARFRFLKSPQFLLAAGFLAILSAILYLV